jgi:hypothetical protein
MVRLPNDWEAFGQLRDAKLGLLKPLCDGAITAFDEAILLQPELVSLASPFLTSRTRTGVQNNG